ncbi:flavin monoamine oxidase family protein [Thalassospira australica]|uniref:flavin monoamine oxidase family protein n=1 Tax=Thalassospira australica TaxID=1528106 RepID=UPI000AA47FF9|nr:FAD-dependent oxidoreductase [Thalassospira australica]
MLNRNINRRRFIKSVLLTSGVVAVATRLGVTNAHALEGTSVVIVGAGIAGLGAANLLGKQGASVTVVEAKPHIGGRLLTDWSMGAPFEVGAGWIHGPSSDNPTKQLAEAVGAKYAVTDDENAVYFDVEGYEYDEDEVERIIDAWEGVLDHIDNTYEVNDPRSLLQAIKDYRPAYLNDPGIMWAFSAFTEFSKGGAIEKLSAPLFNWDDAFEGADVVVTSGYDEILKPLADGLDIKLSQTVLSIDYSAKEGVVVTTDKGTFTGDYCICSVPLGVLKANKIKFSPELPKDYRNAIEALGFGSVTKLALKFDEPFWDIETQYFGITTEPKGRWNYWLNYRTFSDENILLGLSVGDYALKADRMSDEEMVEDALDVLWNVWEDEVGEPIQIQATHWATDPETLGAYSFPQPGNSKSDFDDLGDPIDGRLILAGEHTIFDYAGTTHGAYMTGLRAAEFIIDEES